MKLYLASYAMVTMDKIIKNEGNSFVGKTAIFIPTAGDPYDNKDFIEADKNALKKYGLKVIELDIKAMETKEIQDEFNKATIVLVAGGDTFYLMNQLVKKGVDNIIKKFINTGGIYIGSSAGSIICCPTIEGAETFDNPSLAPDLLDYKGLDVFHDVIIPHVHKEKYFQRVKQATEQLNSKGFKVYPLTDDDVLFFDGDMATII